MYTISMIRLMETPFVHLLSTTSTGTDRAAEPEPDALEAVSEDCMHIHPALLMANLQDGYKTSRVAASAEIAYSGNSPLLYPPR